MRKIRLISVLLAGCTGAFALPAEAATITFTNCLDGYPVVPNNSFRKALDTANNNGTIYDTVLYNGASNCSISPVRPFVISQPVDIKGTFDAAGNARVTFIVSSATNNMELFTQIAAPSGSNHVIIENFNFIGASTQRFLNIMSVGRTTELRRVRVLGWRDFDLGGGAIILGSASLTVDRSTFLSNAGGIAGGAIFVADDGAQLTVTGSHFEGNRALAGGGAIAMTVGPSTIEVRNSSFVGNGIEDAAYGSRTYWGGAIMVGAGTSPTTVTLTNNTFYGNECRDNGGHVAVFDNVTLTMRNNTLVEGLTEINDTGHELYVGYNASTLLVNNVFGKNNPLPQGQACYLDTYPSAASLHNVVSDSGCVWPLAWGFDNKHNTPHGLASLAVVPCNATRTPQGQAGCKMAAVPQGSNPEVNYGSASNCSTTYDTAKDQRAYNRSGVCDVGAYEYGGTP